MIINLGISNAPSAKGIPIYSYSGRSEFVNEGNGNWKIRLLSSGNLTFSKVNGASKADLFAVGGGQSGEEGTPQYDNSWGRGGNGGSGGECRTLKAIHFKNTTYGINIGGSEGDTTVTNPDGSYLVYANNGSTQYGQHNGGSYGSANPGWGENGSNGGAGVPEFNENGAKRYAGGGGGGYYVNGSGHPGKGVDGGGDVNSSGLPNTGGGGGGGSSEYGDAASGGAGGSGIVIIRNHR